MPNQPVPIPLGETIPAESMEPDSGDVQKKTVFVLGAGFTRAFVPEAPLLIDRYDDEMRELFEHYGRHKHAKRILKLAEIDAEKYAGRVNIERLMTRLDALMPYDIENQSAELLKSLLSHVKRLFVRRLESAQNSGQPHEEDLRRFANYCVKSHTVCITFNYDEFFDQALASVSHVHAGRHAAPLRWHPNSGYGFFAKPSEQLVQEHPDLMENVSTLLLKLHGSANWRVRKGESHPYGIGAILHHEGWHTPYYEQEKIPIAEIEPFLEPDPFIVPPVLMKSSLVEQPILRHLWALAFAELSNADEVVFLGYSLPVTDIAAGFLFGEALRKQDVRQTVTVVVLPRNEGDQNSLVNSYRSVFPTITEDQFVFGDAREWCNERSNNSHAH